MKRLLGVFAVGLTVLTFAVNAHGGLIGVSGPDSSMGTAAAIIGAPVDALDGMVTNSGMEGFNEAQGVTTSVAHDIDGGGSIAARTKVDSHMIFLNSASGQLGHSSVIWTFDGEILGVMSDSPGALEAASTFELGNSGTNYPAGFTARGLEGNNGTGVGLSDGYQILTANSIRVSMLVSQPGDWIRVVTATVPEPASVAIFGFGALGLVVGGIRRRKQKQSRNAATEA